MSVDPFDTAALRAAVVRTWRASPARLREDANLEEDHARGYYRDRVLVELAQNAADAAARAEVPGRLLLRLSHLDDGPVLVAANTGAPLDAAGVAALSSMRASAKRDQDAPGTVGRFGVGFAAVRAVSDEIAVLSVGGAVRFSLADTADALAAAGVDRPELAAEVRRRDGSLPALRLPFASDGRPPEGFDTAVVLRLRDEVAADEVRAWLRGVDDTLLLALPGLVEVVVEDETSPDEPHRRLADVATRWVVETGAGHLPLAALADRPVEERGATRWRVTWALPRTDAAREVARRAGVVHAPTPTDDPLALPALLVATLPLDPTRRHVARGDLADVVLGHAADVYATLAARVADEGGDPLALVPTSLPAGAVDGALRPALVDRLSGTPILRPAGGPGGLVAPARAVAPASAVRDDAALATLGTLLPGLVAVPPDRLAAARTLGVELRPLADLVHDLPAQAAHWPALYDALDALAAGEADRTEALAAVPVPLTDGRVVRGARGTCLLDAGLAERVAAALEPLARWGVRVVDPAAAHPLLERLGAATPDAVGLLRVPGVRQAVLAWDDDALDDALDDDGGDGPGLPAAVLTLVAAALPPRDPSRWSPLVGTWDVLPDDVREWLALVPLRAATGESVPADGLVLPGTPAERLLDDRVLTTVAREEIDRWGAATLVAAGVREDLVTFVVPDVLTGQDADEDAPGGLVAAALDGWDDYLEHLADLCGAGAFVGDVTAVADLDAVATHAWPQALRRLGDVPVLRRALLDPVRSDQGVLAPSYAAWWLRHRAPLDLAGPFLVREASADDAPADRLLDGLLPAGPAVLDGVDGEVQRALGGVRGPRDVTPADWTRLLDGWQQGTVLTVRQAVAVWRHAAPDEPPERVPALVGPGRVEVVGAHEAAVAPSPMWWQRTDVAALVPAPDDEDARRIARALDLPSVAELAAGVVVRDEGVLVPLPDEVRELLPGAPTHWCEHEDLRVDHVPVPWWVEGSGPDARLHAATTAGLAAALAQATGRWPLRHTIEAVLADVSRAAETALDVWWDAPDGEPDGGAPGGATDPAGGPA